MDKNQTILITGATGFVGAYILRSLIQQGYTHIRAIHRSPLDRLMQSDAFTGVEWIQAELEDYFALEDALSGVHTVIHCAAIVSFHAKDKEQLFKVNQQGTKYMVNAALHQGVQRFLHLSSVAALGRKTDGTAIDEHTKWSDKEEASTYALSKFLAEQEVWRGQAEGLSVGVLYPSIVLGAWKWTDGSSKLFAYSDTKPKYYPSGHTGFVDVRDIAQALLLLLERNTDGDRFLLNGANISYQDFLSQMAQALGHPPPTKLFPKSWARILAWLDGWRSFITRAKPLLTKETVQASYRHYHYNNQRSITELNLQYTPIDKTIRETAAIFKQKTQQIELLD